MTGIPTNEEIGRNLARTRGDLSQAKLARRVNERFGTRFSQAMITSIETGVRPLRFNEALMIADILEVPVDAIAHGHVTSDQWWAWRAGVATGTLAKIRRDIDKVMEEMK